MRNGAPGPDCSAPLPLGHVKALQRGLELRLRYGWPYPLIAGVMSEYHGFQRSEQWWSRELRALGAPLKNDNYARHLNSPNGRAA